jgi:hypothetical protein
MPRPVPQPIRMAIWRRCRRGQSAARIAEELSLPPRTVRHLVRRLRDGGEAAIRPDYRAEAADAEADFARPAALALRRQHPRWGAPLIRSLLLRDHPGRAIPSARTIQRWLRRHGAPRPPRSEVPEPPRHRAERPHDVWQMDASERIALADGREVSWLRVVDEYTGAFLLTRVFSRGAVDGRAGPRDAGGPAPGLRAMGPAVPHPRG